MDTGALGRQSAEALNTTAALLSKLAAAGEALAQDSELRGEINRGLVAVLKSFIEEPASMLL